MPRARSRRIPLPPPEWMPELAEVMFGNRFVNAEGNEVERKVALLLCNKEPCSAGTGQLEQGNFNPQT